MSRLGSQFYGPDNVFQRLFNVLVEIVLNRLKILSLELREDRIHFIQIFITATFTVSLAVLTVVLITFTAIYAIGQQYRMLALLIAIGVFLVATSILVLVLVRKLSNHPFPFTDAISEITRRKE